MTLRSGHPRGAECILSALQKVLKEKFDVEHTTIQLEGDGLLTNGWECDELHPTCEGVPMYMGLIAALLTSVMALGQASPFSVGGPILKAEVELALIPVTVTDHRGALVMGLSPEQFAVKDGKQSQNLVSVSYETDPASVGIIFDVSGSMRLKNSAARASLKGLLETVEPDDEVMLVTFANTATIAVLFTPDLSSIRNATLYAESRGSTALFDAIALTIRQMKHAKHQRKLIFLISDGEENHSRLSDREFRRFLEEADVPVHAVSVQDLFPRTQRRSTAVGGEDGSAIMREVSDLTGGQHYTVNHSRDGEGLALRVGSWMHEYYLLGYKPAPHGQCGKYRAIEVKVTRNKGQPRLYVYSRPGYWMP